MNPLLIVAAVAQPLPNLGVLSNSTQLLRQLASKHSWHEDG